MSLPICFHCKQALTKGIEDGLMHFCSPRCRKAYYINSGMGQVIHHEEAESFLLDDLEVLAEDPDYPKWLTRCTGLFKRFEALKAICEKPLGDAWGDEKIDTVDDQLDMLESKIRGAEETLGLTST